LPQPDESPRATLPPGLIPVAVVTGSLGSGKTTLIGRVLRDPDFSRTAVIVNEFGEIPLDHDLITASDDGVLTLATGCLCCTVQSDLARTMLDLHGRREAGLIAYDRLLIETSGLSDPAPLIQALLGDAGIAATHRPPVLITLVDVIHGEAMLAARTEAVRQVALADTLLFSKTDLSAPSAALLAQIEALNPAASRLDAVMATASDLYATPSPAGLTERLADLPTIASGSPIGRSNGTFGHDGIDTFVLTRRTAIPAVALTLFLQALAEHCGRKLLRVKGFVAIAEMPNEPAVIHGVRHVFSPPEFLPAWPSDDRTTRIVFIGTDIPQWFPTRLLEAIEEEVLDANLAP